MTVAQLVALGLSLSFALVGMLCWDFGRRWIEEQTARRVSNEVLAEVLRRQDALEQAFASAQAERKPFNEAVMRKFMELENSLKQLREHTDLARPIPPPLSRFGR